MANHDSDETRRATREIIRNADKLILDQFGLIHYRSKFILVRQSVVYISPQGTLLKQDDGETRLPTDRKEKYLYSSVDRQKSMSIILDIRDDQIFKAEIEALPQTLAAGKIWCQKIRASIPGIKVLINGQEN